MNDNATSDALEAEQRAENQQKCHSSPNADDKHRCDFSVPEFDVKKVIPEIDFDKTFSDSNMPSEQTDQNSTTDKDDVDQEELIKWL